MVVCIFSDLDFLWACDDDLDTITTSLDSIL